jgi:hypothetical protein
MKPILFTFAFAATLAAQNFIQMSDPQFGPCVSASIRTRPSGTPLRGRNEKSAPVGSAAAAEHD